MSNQSHKPTPSSFIGQARQHLKQELDGLVRQFLHQNHPPAPPVSNVWLEEARRDLELLLRSSKARFNYQPKWPDCLFKGAELQDSNAREQLNQCLQEEILPHNKRCNINPLSLEQISEKNIDMQASKMILPALKASFRWSREVSPTLHQHYWLYMNFLQGIGRHLAANKLGRSHTVCVLLCMPAAGWLSCLNFLKTSLERRPDQAETIEWLAFDCLNTLGPELSYKLAKDWQLGEPTINYLNPNRDSQGNSTLDQTIEECLIASHSCLLFNQGLIDKEKAQHYLKQWQLPLQLLGNFQPSI